MIAAKILIAFMLTMTALTYIAAFILIALLIRELFR